MRGKLFVALAVFGAVIVLYSLYVPWPSFTGLIRKYYEAYEVYGRGISSAGSAVWVRGFLYWVGYYPSSA